MNNFAAIGAFVGMILFSGVLMTLMEIKANGKLAEKMQSFGVVLGWVSGLLIAGLACDRDRDGSFALFAGVVFFPIITAVVAAQLGAGLGNKIEKARNL